MTDKTKEMCFGCRDNWYNKIDGRGCWHYADAKVVSRLMIHRDQPPPYLNEKPKDVLHCWRGETGMRAVDPNRVDAEGFWK